MQRSIPAAMILLLPALACGSPLRQAGVYKSRPVPPRASELELAGKPITVVLNRAVSSREVSKDFPTTEDFPDAFAVAEDVAGPDGTVLINQGTPVVARVVRRRHRRIGRQGYVAVGFLSTQAADGSILTLDSAPYQIDGKRRLGGTVAGSFFLTPIFLLRTGGDVEVQIGSKFTTWVTRARAPQ